MWKREEIGIAAVDLLVVPSQRCQVPTLLAGRSMRCSICGHWAGSTHERSGDDLRQVEKEVQGAQLSEMETSLMLSKTATST